MGCQVVLQLISPEYLLQGVCVRAYVCVASPSFCLQPLLIKCKAKFNNAPLAEVAVYSNVFVFAFIAPVSEQHKNKHVMLEQIVI